jgi:hypothetical protein
MMPRTGLDPQTRLALLERAMRDLDRSMRQWHDERMTALSDQSSALKRIEARVGELETEAEIEERVRKELQAKERESSSPWGPPIRPRRDTSSPIDLTPSMADAQDNAIARRVVSQHWRRPAVVTGSVAAGVPTLILLWEYVVKRLIEVSGGG